MLPFFQVIGDEEMAKTRSFSDLVQRHVKDDKKFAEALLREGVDALLSGDLESGKTILRDYIKATVGFEKLGAATGAPPKSLIRMFGPRGNPQAKNLFSVIGYLQKRAGLRLHVTG
jgi:DNA-binding phage protein